MTDFVLDCSVTISWILPDEGGLSASKTLIDKLTECTVLVPSLWFIEVANTLMVAQRRQRITRAQREYVLKMLEEFPVEMDDISIKYLWQQVIALSEQYDLTVYDAIYLELALRKKIPLATLDHALIRACKAVDIEVM